MDMKFGFVLVFSYFIFFYILVYFTIFTDPQYKVTSWGEKIREAYLVS